MTIESLTRAGRTRHLDDLLGPAQQRYFGEGYKRAEHHLTEVNVGPHAHARPAVTARAGVYYPPDWSRKGVVDQVPHLGTTDVLLIAVRLCEAYLLTVAGLDHDQLGQARLHAVRIKAGNTPVERDLGDFPVTVAAAAASTTAPRDGFVRTPLAGTVGPLSFRLAIDHPPGEPRDRTARYGSIGDVLGDPQRRYSGTGFTRRSQHITDLELDLPASAARAQVGFHDTGGAADRGLGWAHGTPAAAVDCFVVSLQLAQILLYALDGIARAGSHTLWMRRTAIDLNPPHPTASAAPVSTRLQDPALLTRDGATWRCADIVGELSGASVRCSVAHRLPSSPSQPGKDLS